MVSEFNIQDDKSIADRLDSEPIHNSLARVVVTQFLQDAGDATTFRQRVSQFDAYLHHRVYRQFSPHTAPRFLIAPHSTETEIVVDYVGPPGLRELVSSAFFALAESCDYTADLDQKSVMTIHGKAVRYLIALSQH